MNNTKLGKCSFCQYSTKSGCMVTPNSYYCKMATDEYYQYIKGGQQVKHVKSLRPWDKR